MIDLGGIIRQEKIFDRGGVLRRRKFSILVVALGILSSASFWRGNQVGGLPRRFTLLAEEGIYSVSSSRTCSSEHRVSK